MTIDNLYVQDPYSGSILKPEFCYIDFPSWPNPIPAVPPYRPSRENEKTYDFQEMFKKLRGEPEYFTKTKDSLKFRLEMAGFAKEDVSVVVDGQYLKVASINGKKPYAKGFVIPDAENYILANPAAQMSNGLLEISFAAKKEEFKTIKIF